MPLVIHDASEDEACKDGISDKFLLPNGGTGRPRAIQVQNFLSQCRNDPPVRDTNVVDADHGDGPIAFASWHLPFLGQDVQQLLI